VLKPSFIMVRDPSLNAIVLAVRGTHSFKDAFTSLTGASKPHHVVDTNGVILGYSHFGMLASARWLKGEVGGALAQALAANPGYQLYIIGHSLGGGTAAMLTMMLREQGGPFAEAQCVAIACPACMTLELAKSCAGYVTTVVNCADVIPTISPGSADALREEVMRSSWASDFRQDMRASSIVRAVESGISRVGTATATATTWTATRLSACYQRRPRTQLKRRNSDDGSLLEASTRSRNDNSGPDRDLPLSTSAPESGGALQQLADEGDSQAQATEWTSLTRITSLAAGVTSFTGRQAQVLGRSVSQTASRLASSQANLLRSWTSAQGTVPAVAGEDASPAREGGEGGAAGLDQRGTHLRMEGGRMEMEMDMDEGQGGEDAFGLSDEGVGALDIDGGEGSLSADASVRMREVERAVSAAEEEERAAGASSGDAVPAVIRPGSYGGASPTGRQDTAAWRRMMYPAGRIMHLVPARLVPGLEWNMDDGETEGGSAIDTESEWPEAHMEGGPDLYEHPEPDRAGPSGEPAPVSQHARQVSELSLRDLVSPEEAVGSALVGGGSTSGPLPPMKPAPGPPPEPMVLLDGVPQEAYGRIKLCRTVLSDHVVPNYLRSLATFQERL